MKKFFKSFVNALQGIRYAFLERSFKIIIVCAAVAYWVAWRVPETSIEKIIIVMVTTSVIVVELLNTSIENLCDLAQPRMSEPVKKIKDMVAAAVLLTSLLALLIILWITLPYLA